MTKLIEDIDNFSGSTTGAHATASRLAGKLFTTTLRKRRLTGFARKWSASLGFIIILRLLNFKNK